MDNTAQQTQTAQQTDTAVSHDALVGAVSLPEIVIVDGQHVRQRPLDDQVAADAYLRRTAVAAKPQSALKFTKLSHTGA